MLKATLTALMLTAAPAMAQIECAATTDVYNALIDKFGHERQSAGMAQGNIMEIWANEDTGSWVMLATGITGRTCIIAGGWDYNERGY